MEGRDFRSAYARAARLRAIAQGKITYALATGALAKASNFRCCDCGGAATEYDHREYAKPMEVSPVCHRCNLRRGRAVEFGGRADAKGTDEKPEDSRIQAMKRMRDDGATLKVIGKRYGISKQRVCQILSGWR